jgi:hypothetical protein
MLISELIRVALVGVGATVVLDMWLAVLKRLGVQTLPMGLIGRWVVHAARGKFLQPSLANAPKVRGEVALGWFTHYAIGIGFAALLFGIQGMTWSQNPSLLPAVIVGMCTVAAPLFVMQPAMGAGFAASRTPSPVKNCIRSTINHTVFGVGLYWSAVTIEWAVR